MKKTPMKNKSKQINLPLQTRIAALDTNTDMSDNTTNKGDYKVFNVVFSTGAKIRRCNIFEDEYYDEELVIEKDAIRLDRLNSGAPVLDTHEQNSLSNVIGIVIAGSVRIENGEARVSIKLDSGAENSNTIRKIKDGIIKNISVGYVVHKFEISQENDDSVPLYRAVDWEPYEISLVPIGADAKAGIRSNINTCSRMTMPCMTMPRMTMPCMIIKKNNFFNLNKETMTKTKKKEQETINDTSTSKEVVTEDCTSKDKTQQACLKQDYLKQDCLKQERFRILEIQKIVQAAKLPNSLSEGLIKNGTDLKQSRKIVLDKLSRYSAASEIKSVRVVRDEVDSMRKVIENALLNRYNPDKFKLKTDAREFRGMSLMEIGRDMMERRGVKTRGLSRTQLAGMMLGLETRTGGYMGTSDFPYILSNIANKTLRAAYESAPQTFKAFTRQTIAPDFKMMARMQLGDAPSLDKVNESGEFKRGALSESKEEYALATYGKVVAINRQVIINDDLDAFTRLPAMFGRAAADLESDTVWSIIKGNPKMGDGVELFHAKHFNLSQTGKAISIEGLGAARESLRKQKGLNGRFINVTAKYLIVPCSLETLSQQFMATGLMYIKNPDVNPFAGTLEIITEPRLDTSSTTAWYLSGDPSQIDTIEYAYLEGNEGVYLESRVGFDVDGIELKARLDFAAKAIDWRGMYKNPGSN